MKNYSIKEDEKVSILLDTNIIIYLEDNKQVKKLYTDFHNKCNKHGIRLFIAPENLSDLGNDKDPDRKKIISSKINKYIKLGPIDFPAKSLLEERFGEINSNNDLQDVKLLHRLSIKSVLFFVTNDKGIHSRARKVGLDNLVFYINEIVEWINNTYEQKLINIPKIESKKCYEIDTKGNDDFFASIINDYKDFIPWFDKCKLEHRDCWVTEDSKNITGLVIWKKENSNEIPINDKTYFCISEKEKTLKLCTFKVSEDVRGKKLGELFLKQSLWYAYENKYKYIYLTAFEKKQSQLISLLQDFGFSKVGNNRNDEAVLLKEFVYQLSTSSENIKHINEYNKKYYPDYYNGDKVKKFIIPIKLEYHNILFPESKLGQQGELFNIGDINKSLSVPGNAINKVYVSHSNTKKIKSGSLIFFYICKNNKISISQSIATLGIVDNVDICCNIQELIKATAKRSVFTIKELEDFFTKDKKENNSLLAINFKIIGYLNDALNISWLKKNKVLKAPPQSITEISNTAYKCVNERITITRNL